MTMTRPATESMPDITPVTDAALEKITSFPKDFTQHHQILSDLKEDIVALCAAKSAAADIPEELRWGLARDMPDFSTDTLYVKRYSLPSMAGIVFLGFFIGGLLSNLLGIIDMGGEIIRVATVLGMLYGAEYLAGNPKARTRLLIFLGLGTLATFAASMVAGILRLTSWADFKSAVLGTSGAPGLLKRTYLLLGAGFLFVLLAKKTTSLDITAFKLSLIQQTQARARHLMTFFSAWDQLQTELDSLKDTELASPPVGKCSRNDCPLAQSVIHLLDGMDGETRQFLTEQLAFMGYNITEDDAHILWDDATHAEFYDTIGLVNNGDHCRVLRRCSRVGDAVIKGHVQKEVTSVGRASA
ncbi:MAG: adenosine deaminase [Desulfovibrio sp.]|nr:adenosine deaminase [Desulfovibrio sp.]